MPAANTSLDTSASLTSPLLGLPFPSVTKSHILHCSYHSWYPRYRSLTPRARLIPLPRPFLDYLRADGIVLPSDEGEDDWTPSRPTTAPTTTIINSPPDTPPTSVENSEDEDEAEPEDADPSLQWPETHERIKETIRELGGAVVPKLNWSAPKDACWISATNSTDCRSANDVYLLLKSSDFIVHDLEQVFDGVVDDSSESDLDERNSEDDDETGEEEKEVEDDATMIAARRRDDYDKIPYHLILRKTIPAMNPALEFRCFVRSRRLLCLCQRDLNHYNFLPALVPKLRGLIQEFFEKNLRGDFPDENFVFDVYVPPPHDRCWLIDINPWAPRTDPLLFSWMEILERPSPPPNTEGQNITFRLHLDGEEDNEVEASEPDLYEVEDGQEEDGEENVFTPEFRLVNRDDPEAYAFNTPQYSAHKLPKDVVDAGGVGEGGIRDFLGRWRELERRQERGDEVGVQNDGDR